MTAQVPARRRRHLAIGALAGIASLAAGAYAGVMATDGRVLPASAPAMTVPVPAALLPAGTRAPVPHAPLTADQHARLRRALWRDPLDQALVDLVYVDAVRRGDGVLTQSAARTLARLGWRHTQAQQNLMLRAAFDGRFGEVVDRADALLRRQKLTDQAIAMLVAMEALPQVHGLVVDKLLGDPNWRHGYLLRIGPQTPVQILDARIRTLRVLLRRPDTVSRAELAPAIGALVANGRAQPAYDLWTMKAGRIGGGNLLRDPRFRAAATRSDAGDEAAIPFEWRFGQGMGHSAGPSPQGATITWDGRGVPVFMNQLVPVRPGRGYLLTVEGRADSGALSTLLAPSFGCGASVVGFVPAGATGTGAARFRVSALPAGCDMADLTIAGDVDAETRGTTIDIGRVVLQPVG